MQQCEPMVGLWSGVIWFMVDSEANALMVWVFGVVVPL